MTRLTMLALAALMAVPMFAATADAKQKKGVKVKVMTRNLFLGADLGPALRSNGFEKFIEANGGILREVDATQFPVRAEGLAGEIAGAKPDLVGLQEVAMWRTGPLQLPPAITGAPFGAVDVKYDFLQTLLDELAERGVNYKPAVVQTEFDFEAPADYNDVDNDAPPGFFNDDTSTNDESVNSLDDAEINGRLTMRDVILVNQDSKVKAKLKNPQMGHFENLFKPTVSGIEIIVTRGWTAGDVTVQKGKGKKKVKKTFRFVNSHFEAFDDETEKPSIRAKQAMELLAGPASPSKTIIAGDFNSDDDTVQPNDRQAYEALLAGGFTERTTADPLSCCVSDLFTAPVTEFDHQVDHIMTNRPEAKVKLVSSTVTGLTQNNGIYDSDHAGIVSTLKIR